MEQHLKRRAVHDESEESVPNLNREFECLLADLESKNVENVDHFKQLISYQKEIISTKNDKNI